MHDRFFTSAGTGFFIGSNQFITNFHVIDGLLKSSKVEDLVLSHDDFPSLKIEKVLALSAFYDLALLKIKTEEAVPHLNLRENLSGVNEDLVILGYPHAKWTQINKTGKLLSSTFKQHSDFFIDHSYYLFGASGSPVLDNKGQVVGVLFANNKNIVHTINLPPLKRFVSGKEGQNCNNSDVKECMRKAFDNLKELAKQGNALAQFELALYFKNEKQDMELAFLWMEKVAEQGYVSAQYELADLYLEDENEELAFFWMEKAAKQDYAPAQYKLAGFYLEDKNKDKGLPWLEKSAKQGFTQAQYRLAVLHSEAKEKKLAFFWMEKAAEQGHALAQNNLAALYLEDNNFKQALIWWMKAEEHVHTSAQ